MDLQTYLINIFQCWQPPTPVVVNRSKSDITLSWMQVEPFSFLGEQLLYRVEMKNKVPPWIVVYSGGKTTKTINNLAPRHPHIFRLKVILKATAVPHLAEQAILFYGDERSVFEKINQIDQFEATAKKSDFKTNNNGYIDTFNEEENEHNTPGHVDGSGGTEMDNSDKNKTKVWQLKDIKTRWLESRWSLETWTSTDSDGTSAVCFSMAVRCGYLKQVQMMLEERPSLIGIINSKNGFTPLATAVRKGDTNTVRYLLAAGAHVDQPSSTGQTPLHLAVFSGHTAIAELLLDKGANFQAQDLNGLRVEHYAVDSGNLEMLNFIMDRGGDVDVRDNNGWTPLFRAVCQGGACELIEELVRRGSQVELTDRRGLALAAAARALRNTRGGSRDSILRLVDSQYPREKALANFTRLTKKISSVHSLIK